MDFQFIKTTACLTGLGLCSSLVGCQSTDKQDYYQPHGHRGEMVQQVPQAHSVHSAPGYSQQAPMHPSQMNSLPQNDARPMQSGPLYTPKQQHQPRLIAPPGQGGSLSPPMAPPAVPGVAPYGAPNGGVIPVPAPTSWVPAPQGGYMPASYLQPQQVSGPWAPHVQQNQMGPFGLITPETPRTFAPVPMHSVSQAEQVKYLPVRFDSSNVVQNSGQGLFAPGWQDRQTEWTGNRLQMTTPWQMQQNVVNPVVLNPILQPQSANRFVTREGTSGQQFMISPPSSTLVDEWPLKVDETELVNVEEFVPDENVVEAFVSGDLPIIQPEIRHRLQNAQAYSESARKTPVSRSAEAKQETAGPMLLRFE
ncbi:hypothetical protein Pla110_06440 [Polystyrenella longa]|uniref:Uncharacterized protein n=1 Tax=Polystyrenella longa TaxID=2528007 RepID=A0A518CIA4_9PLAN|nr:hypothetical protein [Polystyrenella longa]QDU78940.1 hypothetical protein Pla110_06440 [Polystyrenella longa]